MQYRKFLSSPSEDCLREEKYTLPFLIQHQLPCISGLLDYLLVRLLLRYCKKYPSPGSLCVALCTRSMWWAVCFLSRPCKLPSYLLLQHHEMGKITLNISSGMETTSVIHVLLPTPLTLASPSEDSSELQQLAPDYNIPWCDCYSILACSQGFIFPNPLQKQGRMELLLEAFPEFSGQI